MRLTGTLAPLALIACGLANGAGAQLYARPITDAAAVYELDGYSVRPPQGSNWFEMRRDQQQVLFGKKIDSRTHSFAATATSGVIAEKFEKLEQFQEFVDGMRFADVDPARYRMVEYNSELDVSFPAQCVRYHLRTEDRGAPYARGRVLQVDHFGVTCLHPARPDLIIDVGYSEGGRPAEASRALRAEGDDFVRSLKFTPR